MDQAASHFVNASCIPLPSFYFDRSMQISSHASVVMYSELNNVSTILYSVNDCQPKTSPKFTWYRINQI